MLIEFRKSKNLTVNKTFLYFKMGFLNLGFIDILRGSFSSGGLSWALEDV